MEDRVLGDSWVGSLGGSGSISLRRVGWGRVGRDSLQSLSPAFGSTWLVLVGGSVPTCDSLDDVGHMGVSHASSLQSASPVFGSTRLVGVGGSVACTVGGTVLGVGTVGGSVLLHASSLCQLPPVQSPCSKSLTRQFRDYNECDIN